MSMLSQRQAPAIDWLGCLQAVFHPLSLSKDDHVLLHNLPYIVHMSQIINKWQNKPDISNRYHRTFQNITFMRVVFFSFNPFLSFGST